MARFKILDAPISAAPGNSRPTLPTLPGAPLCYPIAGGRLSHTALVTWPRESSGLAVARLGTAAWNPGGSNPPRRKHCHVCMHVAVVLGAQRTQRLPEGAGRVSTKGMRDGWHP